MKEPPPSDVWKSAKARADREGTGRGIPPAARNSRAARTLSRIAGGVTDSPNLVAMRADNPVAAVYGAIRTYIELAESNLLSVDGKRLLAADFDQALRAAYRAGYRDFLPTRSWPPTVDDLAAWNRYRGETWRP